MKRVRAWHVRESKSDNACVCARARRCVCGPHTVGREGGGQPATVLRMIGP